MADEGFPEEGWEVEGEMDPCSNADADDCAEEFEEAEVLSGEFGRGDDEFLFADVVVRAVVWAWDENVQLVCLDASVEFHWGLQFG